MSKNIFLVIGNGFTINLFNHSKLSLDPSKPLYNFNCSNINYHFRDYIPELFEIIDSRKSDFKSDFDCIDSILKDYQNESRIGCYLRRFLSYSYASLYQNAKDSIDYNSWPWSKWIQDNNKSIVGCLNFNYDLFFEDCLTFNKILYYRSSTDEMTPIKLFNFKSIPIFKPHGSIDFDIKGINADEQSAWTLYASECSYTDEYGNSVMNIIAPNSEKFIFPRSVIDLIPPTQSNFYRHYNWIDNMYTEMKKILNNVDTVVLFGFSYSSPDRCEFGEVFRSLPKKNITFFDINITKNNDLKKRIEYYGHTYKFCKEKFPF